jgi:hypothetical protein
MNVMAIDTLKFVTRLKEAGVSDTQAEVHAEALVEAFDRSREELATKADLKAGLTELEQKIRAELLLLKWMLGVLVAGVLALIMKAFFIA